MLLAQAETDSTWRQLFEPKAKDVARGIHW
jgi:hypothetical protein